MLSLKHRGTTPSLVRNGGALPSSGIALCKCVIPRLSFNEGAVPSSGVALCNCVIPPLSHDEGTVPSSSWGVLVPCGSARVLAQHSRGAEVAVVVVSAVGAGTGVVNSVSQGSSFVVESSVAPLAET